MQHSDQRTAQARQSAHLDHERDAARRPVDGDARAQAANGQQIADGALRQRQVPQLNLQGRGAVSRTHEHELNNAHLLGESGQRQQRAQRGVHASPIDVGLQQERRVRVSRGLARDNAAHP